MEASNIVITKFYQDSASVKIKDTTFTSEHHTGPTGGHYMPHIVLVAVSFSEF